MPRKRHVSRNTGTGKTRTVMEVMPRKRHVSRNSIAKAPKSAKTVMPRKRHVSRNVHCLPRSVPAPCHASQEACE